MRCRLVIDSSLVDWSEDLSEDNRAGVVESQCEARDVMSSILNLGYHLALSRELHEEIVSQLYDPDNPKHGSREWPRKWMQIMDERRQIDDDLDVSKDNSLEGSLMCDDMAKDAHLIESALSSDGRVISRDENILACWIGHCRRNPPSAIIAAHPKTSSIVWADPQVHHRADIVWWLEAGADRIDAWKLDRQEELEHHCGGYQTDKCVLDKGKAGR